MPTFAVDWVPAVYTSPIDDSQYESESGWNEYLPNGQRGSTDGSEKARIILLTSESEVAERTTVAELSALIGVIMREVEAEIAPTQGARSDLVVECEVGPGKEKVFRMAQRPSVDQALATAIAAKLAGIDPPLVKGPIRFQVSFKVRGGHGRGDWHPVASPQAL